MGLVTRQLTQSFFLANPPIINSIDNNVGTISGGTEIEISGDNFQPGEFGDASDGDITIASSKNINTDIIAVDRTCADGISYNVLELTKISATIDSEPASGCLTAGDEVILVNIQGNGSEITNLGNYEILKIDSISGSTIVFTTFKTKYYGEDENRDNNIGLSASKQKVILQRVPNYDNLTINAGTTLTASPWSGSKGGILAFRVNKALVNNGTITVANLGFRGGANSYTGQGMQGESYSGIGQATTARNGGAGGGGYSNRCAAGPGGPASFITAGIIGVGAVGGGGGDYVSGAVGQTLPRSDRLILGSGGGGGSHTCNAPPGNGGKGGGAILIHSRILTNQGTISAEGEMGETANADAAGGSGSGGTIILKNVSNSLGTNSISSNGGNGYIVPGIGNLTLNYFRTTTGSIYASSLIQTYTPHDIVVKLGNLEALNINYIDSETISFTSPEHSSDTVDLTVTNPDGQSDILINAYTYDYANTTPSEPFINNNSAQTGKTSPASDIMTDNIVFSAIYNAPQAEGFSTAMRIQVSTDVNFTDLKWDSNKTPFNICEHSNRCSDIQYNGLTLAPLQTYYWRIRFWDGDDIQCNWSAISQFTTSEGYMITNLPENLAIVDTVDWNTNINNQGRYGDKIVGIKSGSNRIAELELNYSNNYDWSNLTAASQGNKAIFHYQGGVAALPGYNSSTNFGFSLFVPKNEGYKILVCPAADNFAAIKFDCLGGYFLNETNENVSIISDQGITYWKISGLMGTGAMSVIDKITDVMTRMSTSTTSDHNISFGTSYGLLGNGDTILLDLSNTNENFDLSDITIADIILTDTNSNVRTLAATAAVDTWGVTINSTDATILFTAPISGNGYYQAATSIIIKIGIQTGGSNQIVNPSIVGQYDLTITLSNLNSSDIEQAILSIPIVDSDQIKVDGFVTSQLYFDIDAAVDDIDCEANSCSAHENGLTTSNYSVSLGELSANWVNQSNTISVQHSDSNQGLINSIYIDISSNISGGAVVYIKSLNAGLKGPNTNYIVSVADGDNITAGSGLYGFSLTTEAEGTGTIVRNANCTSSNTYCGLDSSFKEVFNTDGNIINDGRVRIDFAASPGINNNPGIYQDTLVFTVTTTF